jgi:hypothetical protein
VAVCTATLRSGDLILGNLAEVEAEFTVAQALIKELAESIQNKDRKKNFLRSVIKSIESSRRRYAGAS